MGRGEPELGSGSPGSKNILKNFSKKSKKGVDKNAVMVYNIFCWARY